MQLNITDTGPPVSLTAFFVLLGMAIYTGVTINFLGRRFGDWRFSWSYILGWVAMLMTFFAGEEQQTSGVPSAFACKAHYRATADPEIPDYSLYFLHNFIGLSLLMLRSKDKIKLVYDLKTWVQGKHISDLNRSLFFACCRYFLHMCLQNVWVQERNWPALEGGRRHVY